MHKSEGVQAMEEDAGEAAPAADADVEPGEQPVPKKQKLTGRKDPSASQVRTYTHIRAATSASVLPRAQGKLRPY